MQECYIFFVVNHVPFIWYAYHKYVAVLSGCCQCMTNLGNSCRASGRMLAPLNFRSASGKTFTFSLSSAGNILAAIQCKFYLFYAGLAARMLSSVPILRHIPFYFAIGHHMGIRMLCAHIIKHHC